MHIQRVIPAVSQFRTRDVQFVQVVLHMYTTIGDCPELHVPQVDCVVVPFGELVAC